MYVGVQERMSVSRATCVGAQKDVVQSLGVVFGAGVARRLAWSSGTVVRCVCLPGTWCRDVGAGVSTMYGVLHARLWRMSGVLFGESPCVSRYLAYKGIYRPFQASHLIEFDGGTTFLAVWHKHASF